MRLHRFYTPISIQTEGTNSLPDTAQIHQISKVLRLREGDKAIFFNGSGKEFLSEIVSLGTEALEFRVLETRVVKQHAKRKISLAFSLIKKDNIEWIIEKCTELGVSEFIPIISERSEKKGFNMERAQKISIEACEQSGRGDIPVIHEPVPLDQFLAAEKRKLLVFHMDGDTFNTENFSEEKELVACIGPEGGWSEKEMEMFTGAGAVAVSMNTPVLRAETAAIAALTLLTI